MMPQRYFKPVTGLSHVDIYRALVKKLLVADGRRRSRRQGHPA